jgi:hypothetical protein
MPTPSLILVPARFKTGKLYTPVATTSGGLVLGASGDFNVTRNTTATRVNANGFIESVASGIPRLDYYTSGGTAGCPALLVEPSGSNLCLQSQTLDVSGTWVAQGGTLVSANATGTLSPDGLNTAEILTLVSGGANQLYQNIAMASGTTYTASIFLKNIALTSGQTFFFSTANQDATINQVNCTIDLANATITSGSMGAGVTVSNVALDNYGNGWYRARFTFSFAVGGSGAFLRIRQNSNVAYNTAFYAWGAQFETGSIATSYIPTTTAAVTRNADQITVTGAVSGCIGQTQGTIYAEFRYLGVPPIRSGFVYLRTGGGFRGFSINYSTADLPLGIRFESRNANGTTSIQLTSGLTVGAYYKIAIAYDTGGTAAGGTQASGVTAYVNGSPATVSVGDLKVPSTDLNEVRLYGAISGSDSETPNGNIRSVALYTTKLSNAELAAITTP